MLFYKNRRCPNPRNFGWDIHRLNRSKKLHECQTERVQWTRVKYRVVSKLLSFMSMTVIGWGMVNIWIGYLTWKLVLFPLNDNESNIGSLSIKSSLWFFLGTYPRYFWWTPFLLSILCNIEKSKKLKSQLPWKTWTTISLSSALSNEMFAKRTSLSMTKLVKVLLNALNFPWFLQVSKGH